LGFSSVCSSPRRFSSVFMEMLGCSALSLGRFLHTGIGDHNVDLL
jgi:hypothetical protein